MARHIDADKIDYTMASVYWGRDENGKENYRRTAIVTEFEIDEMPTADVVEVVRCRDCEHYDKKYHNCNLHSEEPDQYSSGFCFHMDEEDFCSYGKRKAK